MTEPYVPQVGQMVRRTMVTEGVVRYFLDGYSSIQGPTTTTHERLPDPEPEWEPGDIVIDAEGDVYVRRDHLEYVWDSISGRRHESYPIRPLARLVRETRA